MSTTTAQSTSAGHRAFISSRLGSILAIAPLGLWVVVHLWHNLAALQGPEAWQSAVTGYETTGSLILSSVVVLAPLAIHTVWGIKRLLISRPNNQRYGFFENFKYLLQRISAIGVFFFILAHLWLAFIHPRFVEGRPEQFADFAHEMRHDAATLPVYLLGTLGVAYHLANGVYGFAMTWGLAASRASLHKFQQLAMGLFVVLLAMSWAAVFALWSAG
jgi:succinate dehydrogenase / fumarate reductase, cytochrome b subunit